MWSKNKQHAPVKATDSLIGHGGTLEGKVHCDTNLRIEGNFTGEINCLGTVTVGEQGTARSSIKAQDIIIAGKVYGDVIAGQRLTLTGTGRLHGNIVAGSLNIMEGSVLNGSVAMTEEPATEKAGGLHINENTDKAGKRGSKAQNSLEAG
ncbi:polymer-forming cytoskeletal protein [Paenibacillus sp. S150]|uniref:bactofilin family protein n=1 Tax=Paenibacillus sp. S150 TaxID=2749826 RepID=UPI001C594D49|nr:polymer-forming cytoskeletal protein [Paenibacillus sp. S150]MBW4081404.1 polymer-forming cytoskeletal protein [Paenibacillus sp. S150]